MISKKELMFRVIALEDAMDAVLNKLDSIEKAKRKKDDKVSK